MADPSRRIAAYRQHLGSWVAANGIDPATVLDDGSLYVDGQTIHYTKVTVVEGGGIHRQPMTAPLVVPLERREDPQRPPQEEKRAPSCPDCGRPWYICDVATAEREENARILVRDLDEEHRA